MSDLQTVKELYRKQELNDVLSILSERNLADRLNKIKNQLYFMTILEKAKIDHHIQQWIIRKKCENSDLKKWECKILILHSHFFKCKTTMNPKCMAKASAERYRETHMQIIFPFSDSVLLWETLQ